MIRNGIFGSMVKRGIAIHVSLMLVCLLAVAAFAQDRRAEADAIFESAEQLRLAGTPESRRAAIVKYEAALAIYVELGVKDREAAALNNIAHSKSALGERDEALVIFARSLAVSESIGNGRLQAITLLNIGQIQNATGKRNEAKATWDRGLAVARSHGEREMEAAITNSVGFALFGEGEVRAAREKFVESLAIFRELGMDSAVASLLNNLGRVDRMLGEQESGLVFYQQALEAFRKNKNKAGEADVLLNLATVYSDLFRIKDAIEHSNRALEMFREMGNAQREAVTLNNVGVLYLRLSDNEAALDRYLRSAAIAERIGDKRQLAVALKNIGNLYLNETGELPRAIENLGRGLETARVAKDRASEGEILGSLGAAHSKLGDYGMAEKFLQESITILRAIPHREGEMNSLVFYGDTESRRGDQVAAIRLYEESLKISRDLAMPLREGNILVSLAMAKRANRDIAGATNDIERAFEIFDHLRERIPGEQFRSAFFAVGKTAHELYIDLLLGAGEANTDPEKVEKAFDQSERSRARSLLDLLTESNVEIRRGVDQQLLEQERIVKARLNNKENLRLNLLRTQAKAENIKLAEIEIEKILLDYRQIQAQIRISSPNYFTMLRPEPLTLKQVRSDVLDDDSILLEYSLGNERSYVWTITNEAAFVYLLPKRSEIETSVRRYLANLTARNETRPNETPIARKKRLADADKQLSAETERLSQALLAPFFPDLKGKRILVVADGILQYLPFAALTARANGTLSDDRNAKPDKASRPVFLAETNEIVYLPSASTIAVMRERQKRSKIDFRNLVSIMADPVFASDDVRFRTAAAGRNGKSGSGAPQGAGTMDQLAKLRSDFGRLRFSRREAEWISEMAPADKDLLALDFGANRSAAMSQSFGNSKFVHFATHGVVNSEYPELSGIVLSLWDEAGREQDGFLRLHDIYNLKLNADLVVLSACETALGKEIRGEGIVGLSRGFMYAGAPSVVASLWRVDDRATADLMRRFYQRMIREGLPPVAALRGAQSSMLAEKNTSHPFYWAGFTLQGEWQVNPGRDE